jgi:endogenous inhibitor of DNA gyrase (YacG/DUF329 family)
VSSKDEKGVVDADADLKRAMATGRAAAQDLSAWASGEYVFAREEVS